MKKYHFYHRAIIYLLAFIFSVVIYLSFSTNNGIAKQGIKNKQNVINKSGIIYENLNDTVLVTSNYTYIRHSSEIRKSEIQELALLNAKSVGYLQNKLGKPLKPFHIQYNLYNSFEEKGLITNNTSISNYEESNESVHSVINNFIKGDDFTQDVILLLRKNYGQPKYKFLETGMSVYFARSWRGFDYKYWASKLFLSDNVPALKNLLDNQKSKTESYLITDPLAGTFVEFLIQKMGVKNLMIKYANWSPYKFQIKKLNIEWLSYLSNLSKTYKRNIYLEKNNFLRKSFGYLKGISYAHVGYDIYNGYLSGESYQSLKALKQIGVNAISIMPFTSMSDPSKPEPLRFWQSAFAENDESLIFLEESSLKLNFVVMLKPHIWVEHGWPGEIRMDNKSDWNKFFDYYYIWIRHYAMLAEMYKIPILCIGNELSQTTVGHEKKWIQIVENIRKLYDGKITYGANWNNEFEKLNFWKYFDYIGISQYYPLSEKSNPSNAELQTGADSIISRVRLIQKKFDIPVLFTELGYKSSMEPWKTALEENPEPELSSINQARCYEAMLRASYEKKWLAGMFWWKWPSYLGYAANPKRDLYVPLNKPAENIIRKWYLKDWN